MKALIRNATSILAATLLLAVSCTSGSGPSDSDSPDGTVQDGSATRVISANAVNKIDPTRTAYARVVQSVDSAREAAPDCAYESDARLVIGGLLPQTGKLSYLEPAQQAAIDLALNDIAEAGGITDHEVVYLRGDSGANGTSALAEADRHITRGADVIFGPPSSTLSKQITANVTGACRLQMSGANTAAGFEPIERNQLYFRTAASDALQGQALSEIVAESGVDKVSIVAEQGEYGQALSAFTAASFAPRIEVNQSTYNPEDFDFSTVVDAATSSSPDAIVVIGFEESSVIIKELLRRGITTDKIYLSDGNAGNALGKLFTEPDELDGIRGVLVGSDAPAPFRRRLLALDDITDFSFSPETYDAIIILALAAELAQSDAAPDIARKINGVTAGGTRCSSFTQCKTLIVDGETDIDYNGISGPLSFNSNGEPTVAKYAIVEFG